MTEQEKRNAIRTYFTPFPRWTLVALGLGVILVGSGEGGPMIVGLAAIAAAAVVLFQRTRRISDAEFDEYREEDLRNSMARAVQKWGIDEGDMVAAPVRVFGPAFVATRTQGARKGKDGIIRFNPIRFAVLGFCEHQLLAYLGVLDMVTGNVVMEETEEYFYRDVVAVATRTDSVEFTHRGVVHQLNDAETFILTTSGATSIRVPIQSPRLAGILGGGAMPSNQADEAIAAVRAMLRQKKGTVPA